MGDTSNLNLPRVRRLKMHIPQSWPDRLTKVVRLLKSQGSGGPPSDPPTPKPKPPPFKIPANVAVRPVKFERLAFNGLEDVGMDLGGMVEAEWVEPVGAHGGFSLARGTNVGTRELRVAGS